MAGGRKAGARESSGASRGSEGRKGKTVPGAVTQGRCSAPSVTRETREAPPSPGSGIEKTAACLARMERNEVPYAWLVAM